MERLWSHIVTSALRRLPKFSHPCSPQMTQSGLIGTLRGGGMAMMIHDARAPEETVLHLSPLVPPEPTGRTAATRL